MPEWPEIHHLARQMAQELPGIALYEARIAQPKCLNLPEEAWRECMLGRVVQAVRAKGKWLDVALEGGYRLRINLGMGGEILLSEAGEAPAEKWRALFSLADGRKIGIHFWWFGSLHAVGPGEAHPPFDKLGPDMLSVDEQDFARAYAGRRSPVKVLLLKQEILSGMGNYYVHDVLFRAAFIPRGAGTRCRGRNGSACIARYARFFWTRWPWADPIMSATYTTNWGAIAPCKWDTGRGCLARFAVQPLFRSAWARQTAIFAPIANSKGKNLIIEREFNSCWSRWKWSANVV